MKRTLTIRRLYENAILAGTLSVVLLSSSCASSRKASSEASRSDSLRTSVTEQTTYVPVPKRTATVKVNADRLMQLPELPEGLGMSYRNNGISIEVKSDGQGGVDITATADSTARQVTVVRKETEHRIRDETARTQVKEKRPGFRAWIGETILAGLMLLLVGGLIKKYLNKH